MTVIPRRALSGFKLRNRRMRTQACFAVSECTNRDRRVLSFEFVLSTSVSLHLQFNKGCGFAWP